MTLTLPIVIGKRYVRRDGKVIATQTGGNGTALVGKGEAVFCTTGRANRDGGPASEQDLISDAADQAHPHWLSMKLYADDAAQTSEPWLRWQCRNGPRRSWTDHAMHPAWFPDCEYRRKPLTIRIGEFDVPEPLREAPTERTLFYYPDLTNRNLVGDTQWLTHTFDVRMLRLGFVHLTREAAEQHARALLSFTEQK